MQNCDITQWNLSISWLRNEGIQMWNTSCVSIKQFIPNKKPKVILLSLTNSLDEKSIHTKENMPSYHLVYIVILPSFQLLYYLPRHQVHPLPKVLHLQHQAHRSHLPVCNQLLWALLSAVPILARMEERVLYQATFACVQNITCGTCALFMLVSEWVGAWLGGWLVGTVR